MTRYSVSGTLTPDATTADTGEAVGTEAEKPYFDWTAGGRDWRMCWNAVTAEWAIIPRGVTSSGFIRTPTQINSLLNWGGWWRGPQTESNAGEYAAQNGSGGEEVTGTATVAEIVEPTPTEYAVLTINDGPLAGEYIVLKTR